MGYREETILFFDSFTRKKYALDGNVRIMLYILNSYINYTPRIAILIHRKLYEIGKKITYNLLHFFHSFRIVQRMGKSERE